jgi:hypothetical protein
MTRVGSFEIGEIAIDDHQEAAKRSASRLWHRWSVQRSSERGYGFFTHYRILDT